MKIFAKAWDLRLVLGSREALKPTGVPDVRVLFLVPGGKVHQKLIQFRV